MEPFVGISNSRILKNNIKNELLLFDKISIIDFKRARTSLINRDNDENDWKIPEFEWLKEKGYITEAIIPDFDDINNEKTAYFVKQLLEHIEKRLQSRGFDKLKDELKIKDIESFVVGSSSLKDYIYNPGLVRFGDADNSYGIDPNFIENTLIRLSCAYNQQTFNKNSVNLLLSTNGLNESNNSKDIIINLVIKKLPLIDNSVSWEQIHDFKSDTDSRLKYLALRNWMSDLSKKDLPIYEIEEKLEFLIEQYKAHLNIHKMKYKDGLIKTVVVSTADLAENLVKFKWGKLARSLFDISKNQISLMESELKSPGSEIAYIIKSQESFR